MNEPSNAMTAINLPRADRAGTVGIASWCLFDWAMSAFNTVITTFVFAVYFQQGIYGDVTDGSAAWGTALGLSGLAVAV
ncbi:MAG TPA: MFS transporter, partial [Alphaproteobacteria bacterium]|nr:MFS transporter [Alphaproteobacteria bacterium]